MRLAIFASVLLISTLARAQAPSPGSSPPGAPALQSAPAPQGAPVSSAPVPPTPLPFEKALLKASNDLFSKANLDGANGKVRVVIDPLIDGITGARSKATLSEERQIALLVKEKYPQFEIEPFKSSSIAGSPVVLIGTFTAINNAGVTDGPRDVYRICLALADLKSRKIISKGVARALPAGIDPTPTAYFSNSPVYYKDAAVDAYVKSCQGSKVGDPIGQAYADHVLAAALISNAIDAYDQKHYQDAYDLYKSALNTPGGADQIRVFNGLYLASVALHNKKDAKDAFRHLIDVGVERNKLAVKFLFQPNSTIFIRDRQARKTYKEWLSTIADRIANSKACVDVFGHTSASGLAAYNNRLSELRAKYIQGRLESVAPALHGRMQASGKGSSELIVGTGRDDASDALDRRVELSVAKCPNSI